MNIPLALIATSERASYARGAPIPLTVTLRNISTAALLVNGRMGVGYEDSLVRELFFTVYTPGGEVLPVPNEERIDAHQMPPQHADFRYLEPGQKLTTVVDVAMWHPFAQAGSYLIVFTYDNSWDGAQFGINAWTGRVRSEPAPIVVE